MNDNTENVLLELLQNGERVSELYQKSRNAAGTLDWEQFKKSVLDARVVEMITGVGTAEIDAALAAVRAERTKLRAAWKGKKMPGEVIDRLSILSDIGIGLAHSKLDTGLTPGYVSWMMEQALPVLKTAVGIIL
jgi:hypothetical protein